MTVWLCSRLRDLEQMLLGKVCAILSQGRAGSHVLRSPPNSIPPPNRRMWQCKTRPKHSQCGFLQLFAMEWNCDNSSRLCVEIDVMTAFDPVESEPCLF